MSEQQVPIDLAVVEAFINSIDLEQDTEAFATPESLRRWLHDHQLLAREEFVTHDDVSTAVIVREGLRALAVSNNDGVPDRRAVEDLNRIAETVPLHVDLTPGHFSLSSRQGGITGALGRLLAAVYRAMAEGTWERFKACRKDSCRWAFFDSSKNRSRTWCSMAVCGNRVKARTYRQRAGSRN